MKITLRAARINANITQEEAAKKLGIANSTLSFIENGTASPRFKLVEKMCKLYGVNIENVEVLKKEK